jgi:hypothetical protein
MAIGTSTPDVMRPATSHRAYLAAIGSRVAPSTAYLAAARQSRLCALACPAEAKAYKARARYWLAMAGVARRAERNPLP